MAEYKFKTSLKCMGCISTITPFLDNEVRIENWSVDLSETDKILTIEAKDITEAELIEIINKAGYKAERI